MFEPRYRALVEHCLAGDEPEFGVVLIERGSEVGGGDTRFGVGTVARIVEASQFPDGRYALADPIGTRRLRGARMAARRSVPAGDGRGSSTTDPRRRRGRRRARDAVEQRLRRVLALATELGAAVAPGDVRLDDDPVRAAFEACALAPIGPLDAQRLLELDDPSARLARLDALLVDTRRAARAPPRPRADAAIARR